MTAVLTAQINCRISEDLKLNASATGLINGTQRLTPANQCTCMFFNLRQPKTGTSPILTLGAVEIPFTEQTRHLGVVLTCEPKMDGPCSITDPKAKFSCLCAQMACPVSKLRCYSQAPIRRPCSTCPGVPSPVWDGCSKRDSVALERIQLAVAMTSNQAHPLKKVAWRRRCLSASVTKQPFLARSSLVRG